MLENIVEGAQLQSFDDSKWRNIDLPHDWSIEDLPGSATDKRIGPFSKESVGGSGTAHTVGGVGWYRKYFTISTVDKGKAFSIQFDGVFNESDVWINGKHVGFHPNGATSFIYDVTPFLNPAGQQNVIAVKVSNVGQTSRWFSGSGIYRHVWISATNSVHIKTWGVHITTPTVSKYTATVSLSLAIENNLDKKEVIEFVTSIYDNKGKIVGTESGAATIQAHVNLSITKKITVPSPELWSPDNPYLYVAQIQLIRRGIIIDTYALKVGIRKITYSSEEGFQINGETIKLRGACMHQDNGILGAAAIDRAEERRVAIMKANGFNAIRCSHNQPSPKFLDACDSLGIMVIDECFDTWAHSKVKDDYHLYFKDWWRKDLESMMLRDRNHASVIMWSIGNEILERADPDGLVTTKQMIDKVRQYDTSRPVTEGVNEFIAAVGPIRPWDYSANAYSLLDIAGYNYPWRYMKGDHKKYPNRIMMTTESFPVDMFDVWRQISNYSYIIGDFVWTGMDYLGESGIGHVSLENGDCNYSAGTFGRGWPWFVSGSGDIDILGFKKAQSYYRDVLWDLSKMEMQVQVPDSLGRKQMISLWGWYDEIACWTWPGFEGKKVTVDVYTKCDSVRLEINGKVIATKKTTHDFNADRRTGEYNMKFIPATQLTAQFDVPYAAGELKAIGFLNGREVVHQILKTVGKSFKLVLTPERSTIKADNNDLAYIKIEVADEHGNIVPNTDIAVDFTVTGEGSLAAVGNASPNQMASFRQPHCKLYQGRAMLIIKPFQNPGKIFIKATAANLKSDEIEIKTY